jgi:HEAT repeats
MKLLGVLVLAGACFGQQPRIQNAKLDSRAAGGSLETQVRTIVAAQGSPAWLGYRVARVARQNDDEGGWGCSLEDGRNTVIVRDINTPVPLEGATSMLVLFRISENRIQRLRTVSPDCLLDAGGLPFYWIDGAQPSQSIALMEGLLKEDNQVSNLVYAIASTRDPAADAALNRLIDPAQPENVRRSTVFWLSERGRPGYDTLLRLLRSDPSDRVRERAVDALVRSKEPDAIPVVIRAAREDKNDKVRKQAVQALARSKDPRAVRFFDEVLSK